MAKLAIRGHATRGREVIEIPEMLGGKNDNHCYGGFNHRIYFINENGYIESCDRMHHLEYQQFTIEEFLEKFPYKVGDKLLLNNGDVVKITNVYWSGILVVYEAESTLTSREYDSIIAEQLQPYVEQSKEKGVNRPEAMQQITAAVETFVASQEGFRLCNEDIVDKTKIIFRKEAPNKTELVLGDDFEVVVEGDKTYVVRKKPKYPKTYKECCDILGLGTMDNDAMGYKHELLIGFQELLIARDAYWKIAGNWKPNLGENFIYSIGACYGSIGKRMVTGGSGILLFPTEEMRDVFYENFKDLINNCRELL